MQILLYVFILATASSQLIPGGLGPTEPATKYIQDLIDELRGDIEQQAGVGHCYEVFQAVLYRSQVVAGSNYYIKIKVGKAIDDYIHAKVYVVPWENTKSVLGVQVKKFVFDPIESF